METGDKNRDDFHCMEMSLVMRMQFISAMTEMTHVRLAMNFNWAAKGLFFLRGGGGYTHSGYYKTLLNIECSAFAFDFNISLVFIIRPLVQRRVLHIVFALVSLIFINGLPLQIKRSRT